MLILSFEAISLKREKKLGMFRLRLCAKTLRRQLYCLLTACGFSINTLISDLCADEADQGKWSIDAALNKFKSSEEKYWKVALKSGVELNGKIFEKHIYNTTPEDYADYEARYEVAFVTPCSHQVMMKVRFIYHTAENIF